MNASRMGFVWGGLITACVFGGATTSVANAQNCGCGGSSQGSQDIVYESPMSAESIAESLLQETDDPSKVINLTVVIQDKAIVIINGEETYTKGTVRPYIVRGLTPGKEYNFVIEGLFKNEAGAHFTAQQNVKIRAGSQQLVVLKLHRTNRPAPIVPLLPQLRALPLQQYPGN